MSREWWVHGPDERERAVPDADEGGDAAHDAAVEARLILVPCFLCKASAGIPGPRWCPICAGTGYIVTERTP